MNTFKSKLKPIQIDLPRLSTQEKRQCLEVLVDGKVVSTFPQLEYGKESWGLITRAIQDIQSQLEENAKKVATKYSSK